MKKIFLKTALCLLIVGIPKISYADTAKIASIGSIERDAIIVRISTGDVEKKLAKTNQWLPVAIGSDLSDDDTIRTGKNSTILLELPENVGYVRLMPETELKVNKIKVDRSFEGGQIAELSIVKGKVITKVRKFNRKSSKLQIHTKGATAAVRGTSFLTSFNENNETKVLVGDGKVSVKAQGKEVIVQQRESTNVVMGNMPVNPYTVDKNLEFNLASIKSDNGDLKVSGKTDPDAEISLNTTSIFANNDGSFSGNMALKEGNNQVAIKASTIDGRAKVSNLRVIKFTD